MCTQRTFAADFCRPAVAFVALHEPFEMPNVRVDSSLLVGSEIGSNYDPMLSKVIAWGPDRATARRTLDRALASTTVLGVTTNVAFLRVVLADPVCCRRSDGHLARRTDCRARARSIDASTHRCGRRSVPTLQWASGPAGNATMGRPRWLAHRPAGMGDVGRRRAATEKNSPSRLRSDERSEPVRGRWQPMGRSWQPH